MRNSRSFSIDSSQILLNDKVVVGYEPERNLLSVVALYFICWQNLLQIKLNKCRVVRVLCTVTLLDTTLKESLEWVTYTRQHDDPQKRGVSCLLLTSSLDASACLTV